MPSHSNSRKRSHGSSHGSSYGGSRKKCSKGQIKRVSYMRRSYNRGSTKVAATHVPEVCIADRGKPGKGPKILPKLEKEISLRKYGYDADKSSMARHDALNKATKKHPTLKVLRRLNLIANYQPHDPTGEKIKKIMREDVEFLSHKYAEQKRQMSRQSSKGSRKGSHKSSRKGSKHSSHKSSHKSSRKGSKRHSRK